MLNCRDLKTAAGCRFFHPRPDKQQQQQQQQQQFFQEQQHQQQQAPRAFQGRQEVPKIDHFDPGMVGNLQVHHPEENFQESTHSCGKLSGGKLSGGDFQGGELSRDRDWAEGKDLSSSFCILYFSIENKFVYLWSQVFTQVLVELCSAIWQGWRAFWPLLSTIWYSRCLGGVGFVCPLPLACPPSPFLVVGSPPLACSLVLYSAPSCSCVVWRDTVSSLCIGRRWGLLTSSVPGTVHLVQCSTSQVAPVVYPPLSTLLYLLYQPP